MTYIRCTMTTTSVEHWFRNELSFKHAFAFYLVMAALGLTATTAGFTGYADALIDGGAMLMFFLMGWVARRKDARKYGPSEL